VRRKNVLAKKVVVYRHHPVRQRRFFEIAHAVDVESDPVAAADDVLRRLGMRGVGIIEDRRREERRAENGEEDEQQQRPCLLRRGEQGGACGRS
jgi:hypothetical protein